MPPTGDGSTVTVVVAVAEQPLVVAVTVYVPDAPVVTFGMDGFCAVDVNPLGPVQL